MKLRSLLGALSLAFAIIIFIPSQSLAKGSHSHHKGSHNKGSSSKGSKDSKGSSDKGSKCSKGSKDSKGSSDKGSKGSKGSKDSKGSSDKGSKGSKGSKDSKGSSDKGSKGSKGSKDSKGSCDNTPDVPVVTTGTVCGTVYEDIDINSVQNGTEIGTSGIQVSITDINGNLSNIQTDNVGNYCAFNIVEGIATITVEETTLPIGTILTAGINPNDITVIAGQTTDAGSDGYTSIFTN